ncbi:lipid droplet assembly factor 1 isoform X2 [Rhea pennata]|uniref:lipid droplet assembly factor 1 isoform X2 n=1 Tax=Rhea pennata TaxID=8795 RepID=UPI002E274E46
MSKEMQELQKQWHSMVQSIHSNSKVVAFMNSRFGQYLDDHPFVALSLLMFVAVSAIPVAFFLIFVVTTAIMACIGVIIMEGIVCGCCNINRWHNPPLCTVWPGHTFTGSFWSPEYLLCHSFNSDQLLVCSEGSDKERGS